MLGSKQTTFKIRSCPLCSTRNISDESDQWMCLMKRVFDEEIVISNFFTSVRSGMKGLDSQVFRLEARQGTRLAPEALIR